LFVAAVVASAVPALIFLVLGLALDPNNNWAPLAMFVAFAVSLAHILVFGIPLTLLLRKLGHLNRLSMPFSGFLIAAVSYSLVAYLSSPSGTSYSYQAGTEWLVVDGVTTAAGWRNHLMSTIQIGILGALVGSVFYWVMRRVNATPNPSIERTLPGKPVSASRVKR